MLSFLMNRSALNGFIFLVGVSLVCSPMMAQENTIKEKPKNIIMMVGDGMGPSHIKALRLFETPLDSREIRPLILDQYLLGTLATDPYLTHRDNGMIEITDSAASATAYSTGIKTVNGAIAQGPMAKSVDTVLEIAKRRGKRTGLVATSQIVHATPAAYMSHVLSRRVYNKIADQFVDNRYQNKPYFDLFLGGGMRYFKREDRDLVSELEALGYQTVTHADQLPTAGDRVVGLFADVAIPSVFERTERHPSLATMTKAALKRLDNPNGFFLLIEGSQIDWASHDNNVAGMLYEARDFHQAFIEALTFAQNDGETLVLLTADHETGGFSVAASYQGVKGYWFNPQPVSLMKKSLSQYASEINSTEELKRWAEQLTIKLRKPDIQRWQKALKTNFSNAKSLQKTKRDFLKFIVNRATIAGWTTGGHTGVDVNIYGYGPGADAFRGFHSNTHVGQQIKRWLNTDE